MTSTKTRWKATHTADSYRNAWSSEDGPFDIEIKIDKISTFKSSLEPLFWRFLGVLENYVMLDLEWRTSMDCEWKNKNFLASKYENNQEDK